MGEPSDVPLFVEPGALARPQQRRPTSRRAGAPLTGRGRGGDSPAPVFFPFSQQEDDRKPRETRIEEVWGRCLLPQRSGKMLRLEGSRRRSQGFPGVPPRRKRPVHGCSGTLQPERRGRHSKDLAALVLSSPRCSWPDNLGVCAPCGSERPDPAYFKTFFLEIKTALAFCETSPRVPLPSRAFRSANRLPEDTPLKTG